MTVTINGSTGISGVDGSAATPALQGGDTNTGIVFGTDTVGVSTGGVQRTTVDSSGRLLVGVGSATANGGILELSGGITFPATAVAATDANTLDDYEEGTFTPTATGETSAGTTTYTVQEGIYTKIGRQVTVSLSIRYTATTGSGLLKIGGFPFTAVAANSGYTAPVEISGLNWTGGTYLVAFIESGNAFCYLLGDTDDADRTGQNITNEIAVIRFTMTYFV